MTRLFTNPTRIVAALVGLGMGLLAPADAQADTINLSLGGSTATIGVTSIDFQCNPAIVFAPCPGPASTGNFTVTNATGDMAAYLAAGGYIRDLTSLTNPLNEPFLLPNFISFSGPLPPNFAFDLSFIFLGVFPQAQCAAAPASGQVCTPIFPPLVTPANPFGLAAFNFQNVDLGGGLIGSTANFAFAGTRRNIATGASDAFNGVFLAQFTVPYQTVLAALATGTFTNTYSVSLVITTPDTTPVPEPASMMLLGLGLVTLGARHWRQRRER